MNIHRFLTNREFWDYTNQDYPITKDDELDPNKALIIFENGDEKIIDASDLEKYMQD